MWNYLELGTFYSAWQLTFEVKSGCHCDVFLRNVTVNWCREFAVNFAIF